MENNNSENTSKKIIVVGAIGVTSGIEIVIEMAKRKGHIIEIINEEEARKRGITETPPIETFEFKRLPIIETPFVDYTEKEKNKKWYDRFYDNKGRYKSKKR